MFMPDGLTMTQNVLHWVPWCQLSTTPRPVALTNYHVAHTCVTTRASVSRRVSWANSFEMSFSRTVPGGMGVPVLCLGPCVGGCYIHPLSDTVSVNVMAWTWEGQCLDRTRMDGFSGCPDEMSDTWTHS